MQSVGGRRRGRVEPLAPRRSAAIITCGLARSGELEAKRHLYPTRSILGPSVLLILLVAAALSGCRAPAPPNAGRAALVVRGPSGGVQQACVQLRGDKSNGEQVLLDAGWEVSLDAANSMGSIVCAIDGEGCRFPAEGCFCECNSLGSCSYWAYFTHGADGQWVYSPLGARAQPVRDGDLHAWVWVSSTSSEPGALQARLPEVTFDDVCPPG